MQKENICATIVVYKFLVKQMKLSNIVTFFTKHKRMITFSIAFSCMYFLLWVENTAFAAGTDKVDWGTVVTLGNGILKFVALFLALMTYLVSLFLSPEWMNGSLFGIQGYLKTIWVMVSNIVYIVFAFILIGIAFMNIVWVGQDKFQLKQSLPKFIIGILIVPFSWFLVTFMLSLASVLSVIAVNLPFDSFKWYENNLANLKLPTKCTIDMTGNTSANGERELEVTKYFFCDDESPIKRTENNSETIYLVVALYTYGIMGIDTTDMLQHDFLSSDTLVDIFDIIVKLVFDLLFFVVYAILIIALGLVLMIRWFNLWIYIMFSPVFGLMYFFWKNSGGSGFFEKFNVKEFLALAMVPVYSMLALSFGMLFLYIVGQGMTTSSLIYKDAGVRLTGADANTKAETLEIGEFALTFVGPLSSTWGNIWDGTEDVLAGWQIGAGIVLGVLWSLILKIMWIVVLWWTMMAALKSSKITAAIVEPLDQFGKSVGQIVQKAPQYAPVFGGQSMTSMQQIAGRWVSHYQGKAREAWDEWLKERGIWQNAATDLARYSQKAGELLDATPKSRDTAKAIQTAILKSGGVKSMSNSQEFIDMFKKAMENAWLKADDVKVGMNHETLAKYIWDLDYAYETSQNWVEKFDLLQGLDRDDSITKEKLDEHIKTVWWVSTEWPTAPVYEKHTYHWQELQVQRDKNNNIIDIKVEYPDEIESLVRALWTTVDTTNKTINQSKIDFKEKLWRKFEDVNIDLITNTIISKWYTFDSTWTPPSWGWATWGTTTP